MNKKNVVIAGAGLFLLAVCCITGITVVTNKQISSVFNAENLIITFGDKSETPTPTPVPVINRDPVTVPPTLVPQPSATPPPTTKITASATPSPVPETPLPRQDNKTSGQASPIQLSTEALLTQAILPERDQRLLAIRLKNNGQDIPKTVNANSLNYQPGDSDTFWVTDNQSTPPRQFQANATLKFITDHSYWWVEEGMSINQDALKRSAERFENQTYPTNRAFFGSEWSPGVDNDVRVHIFMGNVPGVAGYFSASNSYTSLAEPFSNQREMFFINLHAISPGNSHFDGVLAHEFQHMIHWYQDRNEDTWVNEGLSELATFINGLGPSTFVSAFSRVPNTQLNSWSSNPSDNLANYGGSFLFMAYFLQQYGEKMTQAVVAAPENGVEGFNAVLAEYNFNERFTDIFANFLIANYLQNPEINDGLWGYSELSEKPVAVTHRHAVFPVKQQTTVYQFGADYIELTGNGNITIKFTGSTSVPVVNNQPHSGAYQWYSLRGDDTNTRLTRTFNLSTVDTATLNYWTWYDIEPDWDYGYVEISTDGGETWTILQTEQSATTNPSGNAFGPGYTGVSGNGPTWIKESINLSPYTGQEVQIRFEYVTDDAVNRSGLTIDDISIPEIDFFDDVESGDNGWQTEGFVRMDNILPQHFLAQVLEVGQETRVRSISLDETNYGTLTVENLGSTVDRAVLVVSGLSPVTTEPAGYKYTISQ